MINIMSANERNSNFELLRLVAMLMIVVYHTFHQLKVLDPSNSIIVSSYTILHGGVPIFFNFRMVHDKSVFQKSIEFLFVLHNLVSSMLLHFLLSKWCFKRERHISFFFAIFSSFSIVYSILFLVDDSFSIIE